MAPPGAAIPAAFRRALRDHAHTRLGVILSLLCPPDIRVPTLSIECAPCGRAGRYNVAKLMEEHGDARLPERRGPGRACGGSRRDRHWSPRLAQETSSFISPCGRGVRVL